MDDRGRKVRPPRSLGPGAGEEECVLCTAFRSIVSKTLASSEDGPEQPGRPKARPPWLQVCPSTPTWVKLERLDCHSWGTSALPYSSVFRVGGGGG